MKMSDADARVRRVLVEPFPGPGPLVSRAYSDLWLTQAGSEEEKKRLGSPANLPHPWDPPTCTDRRLRWELWLWLDAVAAWVNAEYCWEPSGTPFIPACWPQHPHIVHELAVLADQRRRCNLAANSDLLENWHRYVLPGFLDRMRERLNNHCDDQHQPWPARGRQALFDAREAGINRTVAYEDDLLALAANQGGYLQDPLLTVQVTGVGAVDVQTGEVLA